jgi:hypothetical protein
MIQITVVALYGDKSSDFAALIMRCQELGRRVIGVAFRLYDPSQISCDDLRPGTEDRIGVLQR